VTTALSSKHSSGYHSGRGRPKNHMWKRDLEKEMWTAGYKWKAGGRWRRQHRNELKMVKIGTTVAYVPPTSSHGERQGPLKSSYALDNEIKRKKTPESTLLTTTRCTAIYEYRSTITTDAKNNQRFCLNIEIPMRRSSVTKCFS